MARVVAVVTRPHGSMKAGVGCIVASVGSGYNQVSQWAVAPFVTSALSSTITVT
jgi:hypothetical protein